MLSIALNLKKARQAAGMTQEAVARKVGITQVAYCRFELGTKIPTTMMMKALSDALEVPIGDLYADMPEVI